MHASTAESHADNDDRVIAEVTKAADGSVTGRKVLAGHLADYHAQMAALKPIADTPFGKVAAAHAAHTAVSRAVGQVTADTDAAHRAAQRIVPAEPSRKSAREHTATHHHHRRFHHVRIKSDGTLGGNAVAAAGGWIGTPYVWGGGGANGPSGGGFDCSGLTQYAIAHATHGQVILPRTTSEQIHCGVRVPVDDVRPGDLVFPASSFGAGGPAHVQLAAGHGMVIEAPHTGAHVRMVPMPRDAVVMRVL
jgi:cell wall-associated NlpC family hydrolase